MGAIVHIKHQQLKVYIHEMLECGWPFTMLVRSHAKAQPAAEVVIEEEGDVVEEEVQIEAEGTTDEGERISVIVE